MFSLRLPALHSLCLKLIFFWVTYNTRVFFFLVFLPAGKADKWRINESCLKMHQLQQIRAWLPNVEQAVSGVGYRISATRFGCTALPVLCSPSREQLLTLLRVNPLSKNEHTGSLVCRSSCWSSDKILSSLKTEVKVPKFVWFITSFYYAGSWTWETERQNTHWAY